MLDFRLVILMAGGSQRFISAGMQNPKALLHVDGKLMIERIIDSFSTAIEIQIIANFEQKAALEDWQNQSSYLTKFPIEIIYIKKHNLGPSFSIFSAASKIEGSVPVIVTYCDVWANFDRELFVKKLNAHDMGFVGLNGFHPYQLREPKFGYVLCDENNYVVNVKEKEQFEESELSSWASAGIYGFRNGSVLNELVRKQIQSGAKVFGEFYLSLASRSLLRPDSRSTFLQFTHKFLSWGTPEELKDFNYFKSVFAAQEKPVGGVEQVPSDLILVAGGKSTRTSGGANNLPKQLIRSFPKGELLLFNLLDFLDQHANIVGVVSQKLADNLPTSDLPNNRRIQIITPKLATRNACETALVGLGHLSSSTKQVTVAATDNLVYFEKLDSEVFLDSDLIVWVAEYYPVSDHRPSSYSWVRLNDSGRVEEISVKLRPDDGGDWKLVIGTFTFKSKSVANALISGALNANSNHHLETHLESVISKALDQELYVSSHRIPHYFTVGSEIEVKIFEYFKSISNE